MKRLLLIFLLILPFTFGVTVSINFANPTHNFKGVGWNINSTNFQNWTDSRIRPLLDSAHMQFARVWGWSATYYAPTETQKDYEAPEMQSLYGFLQYAKENNITVQLSNASLGGSYMPSRNNGGVNYWTCPQTTNWTVPVTNCSPDQYFWLSEISHNDPGNLQNRFCHKTYRANPGICTIAEKIARVQASNPSTDHPYNNDTFGQALADSLDYIVNIKGFNIPFVSIWSEPQGDWGYHPRDSSKTYPSSFRPLYNALKSRLLSNPSLSNIKLIGFDGEFDQVEFQNIKNNIDAVGIHDYENSGTQQVIAAKAATTKTIIIGEAGDRTVNSNTGDSDTCGADRSGPWESLTIERKKSKVLRNSIVSTNNIFSDIKEGAYAAARWWYNGDTGCFVATDGGGVTVNDIAKYNFNSMKILGESIPQANYDFKVLALSVSSGSKLNSVAIDYARAGDPQKIAIWIVNPDSQQISFSIQGSGLAGAKSLKKSKFDNSGNITYFPAQISFSSTQSITETIAPNSILVFTEYNAIPLTENCSNNIDDDGDGLIDCQDSDCAANPVCVSTCITAQGIKTTNTNPSAVSFTVNRPITSYLAWDTRAAIPTGWTSTGQTISVTDSGASNNGTLSLISKNFPAGTASTPLKSQVSNYFIIAKPQTSGGTPLSITAINPTNYPTANFSTGSQYYTDRTYSITSKLPEILCTTAAPPTEICSNGIDDDGDSLTDCADFTDCPNASVCDAGKKCDIQKQCITVPTSTCPDARRDGTINVQDLVRIAKAINENDLAFNINNDSSIDIADLRTAADKIGTNC